VEVENPLIAHPAGRASNETEIGQDHHIAAGKLEYELS
jgi:hypothetical protein